MRPGLPLVGPSIRRGFNLAPAERLFLDDHLPNVHAAGAARWHAEPFTRAGTAEAALQRHRLL